MTVYAFSDSRWHFCDGSLPCHSYFDVRGSGSGSSGQASNLYPYPLPSVIPLSPPRRRHVASKGATSLDTLHSTLHSMQSDGGDLSIDDGDSSLSLTLFMEALHAQQQQVKSKASTIWDANSAGGGKKATAGRALQVFPPTRYHNHSDHVVQLKVRSLELLCPFIPCFS